MIWSGALGVGWASRATDGCDGRGTDGCDTRTAGFDGRGAASGMLSAVATGRLCGSFMKYDAFARNRCSRT